MLPNDPIILLSYINTKLRDAYPSLDCVCQALCIDYTVLTEKLRASDYAYDETRNQFI